MINGNLTRNLRILAGTLISITAIVCATVLLSYGRDVPVAWWAIASLAVAGVVGADVVGALARKGKTDV